MKILKCIGCTKYRKILCVKLCSGCYFKKYRLSKKRHIKYSRGEYPL